MRYFVHDTNISQYFVPFIALLGHYYHQIPSNPPRPNTDMNAANEMKKFEETNIVQYYSFLCQALSDPNSTNDVKLISIITIANTIKARSTHQQKVLTQRWLAQDTNMRQKIRALLLSFLESPVSPIRDTAAKGITAIAISEIPVDQWPELVTQLTNAIGAPQLSIPLRVASMSILGEVCKELSHECVALSKHTDNILNSIATSVADNDIDLKIAGIEALNNALKFCSANFAKPDECKFLMEMMCKAATPTPLIEKIFDKQFKLQAAAWDCLSGVVGYYYNVLQPFIIDIFNCSIAVIQQSLVQIEDEELRSATQLASIQAIEFWYSLATNEEALKKEIQEARENDEQTELRSLEYVQHALPRIAPLLLQCMCLQGDNEEDDSYNITLSALNCLTIFASQSDASIFSIVLPQVEANIASQDWRYRDAALTALGCVLSKTLSKALIVVINLTTDTNGFVATSAAWCIKQYCRYTTDLILEQLDAVMSQAILPSLQFPRNRPTENMCQALYELSQSIYDQELDEAEDATSASQPRQNPLAPHFQSLVAALLQISSTASNATLLMNSYEALGSIIQCGAGNDNPNLTELLQILGQRLQTATQQFNAAQQAQTGADINSYKIHAQGLICAALAHLIYRLPEQYIAQQASNLLSVFTGVLTADPSIATEALSGIEAIIYVLEKDFVPHVEATLHQLLSLIKTYSDVGSVVSRAFVVLGAALAKTRFYSQQFGDQIVQTIFAILAVDTADQTGKLSAIDCFSDLVEVSQDAFLRYYTPVCDSLLAASTYSLTAEHQYLDIDLVEYLLRLQISICRTLDSFLLVVGREGASADNFHAIGTNVDKFITYAIRVVQDSEATVATRVAALDMLADAFPVLQDANPALATQLVQSEVPAVLRNVAKTTRGSVRKIALEALGEVSKLK
jgi:importin subunit beta-1